MNKQLFKHTQCIIIDPGEFYVSTTQEVISTLLGSCVAACLYDPVNNIVGMNHFLLAYRHHSFNRSSLESQEGRYGIHAMELLINDMMAKGANRKNLQAKCFGGGDVLHLRGDQRGRGCIGGANIDFIREFLKNENIPIISSDFGGNVGRKIYFVGGDHSVFVSIIGKQKEREIERGERVYWNKTIKEHEESTASVTTVAQSEFW